MSSNSTSFAIRTAHITSCVRHCAAVQSSGMTAVSRACLPALMALDVIRYARTELNSPTISRSSGTSSRNRCQPLSSARTCMSSEAALADLHNAQSSALQFCQSNIGLLHHLFGDSPCDTSSPPRQPCLLSRFPSIFSLEIFDRLTSLNVTITECQQWYIARRTMSQSVIQLVSI